LKTLIGDKISIAIIFKQSVCKAKISEKQIGISMAVGEQGGLGWGGGGAQ